MGAEPDSLPEYSPDGARAVDRAEGAYCEYGRYLCDAVAETRIRGISGQMRVCMDLIGGHWIKNGRRAWI